VLTITVPTPFDLGMSFGKVKPGNSPEMCGKGLEKVWKFIFKIA